MTFVPYDTVWWNGRLVSRGEAVVPVTTHALHYATSAFEGIRAYWDGKNLYAFRLRDHMRRLLRSGRFYGLAPPHTSDQLCDAVVDTCRANGVREGAYIRPLYFAGEWGISLTMQPETPVHAAVIVFPMEKYHAKKEVSACVVSRRRLGGQAVPVQAKMAGNYLNSILALAEAKQNGFEQAIMLDHAGNLSETPDANVFLVQDNTLVTPDAASSALNGITRDTVMWLAGRDGIRTVQRRVSPDELYTSDEVFITGTATEVIPLTKIGGIVTGRGPGPVTRLLMDRYRDLVTGRGDTPMEWLTPVYDA